MHLLSWLQWARIQAGSLTSGSTDSKYGWRLRSSGVIAATSDGWCWPRYIMQLQHTIQQQHIHSLLLPVMGDADQGTSCNYKTPYNYNTYTRCSYQWRLTLSKAHYTTIIHMTYTQSKHSARFIFPTNFSSQLLTTASITENHGRGKDQQDRQVACRTNGINPWITPLLRWSAPNVNATLQSSQNDPFKTKWLLIQITLLFCW